MSDFMDELCQAQTHEDVVRIAGNLACRAFGVDALSVFLQSGEQLHHATDESPDALSKAHRAGMVAQVSQCALQAEETAVVPDVHRDDRTRSHTNGSTFARSLVCVPVGRPTPFATVIVCWSQEHWPGAEEVLLLEALARATGLALNSTLGREPASEHEERDAVTAWLRQEATTRGLHGAERRYELMLAATEHRVRNSLSLIRSLIRRTSSHRPFDDDYASHLEGRIDALSRTQTLVMRGPDAGVDLEELVTAELLAHVAREPRARVGGPAVRLKSRAAETLGLALHELATNAVKFGALSVPHGQITVSWTRETQWETPSVQLRWIESGVSIDPSAQRRKGFGLEVLERTLPYELRGASTLQFEDGGVRCTIDIPLSPDNIGGGKPVPAA
ncbi:MAG: HWE histidine kinase domain-containing protein [Gammaproteobacteria bacterium]